MHVLGPCQTSLMETPPSLFSCVMRCMKKNNKKKHGNKNKSNDRKEELGPIQWMVVYLYFLENNLDSKNRFKKT